MHSAFAIVESSTLKPTPPETRSDLIATGRGGGEGREGGECGGWGGRRGRRGEGEGRGEMGGGRG